MVERGLLRLDGAKSVKLAAFRPRRGEGVYVVRFESPPAVRVAHIRKEVGRFELRRVEIRFRARVTEKEGTYAAGTFRLQFPPTGDLRSRVDGYLKAGKRELVLEGVLSDGPGDGRIVSLVAAHPPRPKKGS